MKLGLTKFGLTKLEELTVGTRASRKYRDWMVGRSLRSGVVYLYRAGQSGCAERGFEQCNFCQRQARRDEACHDKACRDEDGEFEASNKVSHGGSKNKLFNGKSQPGRASSGHVYRER